MSRDRREDVADWLMVVGGVLLFVSLFLTWSHQFSRGFLTQFGASALLAGVPRDPNAWQVYSAVDVGLALLAVGLVGVALIGSRRARLGVLVATAIALAFTLHALGHPPTSGASVFDPALRVPNYVPNLPRAGAGETVAMVALGIGLAGLALSFTAD